MNFDCKNYSDDKKCPKKLQFVKEKSNSNHLNVIMIGCWGVYCWDGEITLKTYIPPSDDKKGVEYFKEHKEVYGSGRVVQGLIKYTNNVKTDAVFLAGDNVYNHNVPKQNLLDRIANGEFPDKKMYKLNPSISGQNIDEQLQKGFLTCFEKVNVKDFYVAIGNHDIQTCYDLNRQLEFSAQNLTSDKDNRYRLPAVYYNVVYPLKDYRINFIVIDTNIFEHTAVDCSGKKYEKEVINELLKSQIDWIINTLKQNKCEWNIIVGHIPYKSNPHKQKQGESDYILNRNLDYLFDLIRRDADCPKVQAYFCADEHNQQFLYDNKNKLSLIVAGSGGTVLDKKIVKGSYWDSQDIKTMHYLASFGFVAFNFNNDMLDLTFFESISMEKTAGVFNVKLTKNGDIDGHKKLTV